MPILRFLWLALRPISKLESAVGWWDVLNLVVWVAYPTVGKIAPLAELFKEAPLAWFVGIPALLFLIAGIKLQFKVANYEEVPLEISYDKNDPECKRDEPSNRLWRVGVKNSKGRILERVIVRLEKAEALEKAEPQKIPDLGLALHPMSVRGSKEGWEGDGSFSIRPNATEHVDVLRYLPESDELHIVFQFWERTIPYGSYKFTIEAQAKLGKPVTKHFGFEANEDRQKHSFYALEEVNT